MLTSGLMADSSEQPPGFLKPPYGFNLSETLSASKYQPPPKQDDRVAHDMSKIFSMLGRLSISWMRAILNSGPRPGDKSFASGSLLAATNILSLIYLTLLDNTTFSSEALSKPIRYADTTQESALMYSTSFRTMQPERKAKPGPDLLSDQMTQYQGASLATMTRLTELDKEKASLVPPVLEKKVDSGKEPPMGHKGLREVQGPEPELDSSDEEEDTKLLLTLTEYIEHLLGYFSWSSMSILSAS
ncbi:hypothetical protein C0992_009131 [Termitomyces sp. T32_za158]|nr:hypothetical protein C0992_009131 [Termitomyces sp. T32_za158]